jgi:23S rRNA pseudouridine1911/1915/1917 synthase
LKTERKGNMFQLEIPIEWENITIEELLRNKWQAPKKLIHKMRMNKDIQVNGELFSWHKPLQKGDQLQINLFSEDDYGVIPVGEDIDVLYEDDHLLVVNKRAGIDTHPNEPDEVNTLANFVAFYLQAKGEKCRVLHVHRLDRDTSGAIIFAKHALSKAILDRLLTERQIKRTYWAIVQGKLSKKAGTVSEPIGRDRHHNTRRRVSPSGQPATTHYKLLEEAKGKSLIQLQLDTGRTHQIRVHMSYIGHPLAGDTLYGGKPIYSRQALHAKKIAFPHPLTGETIECKASFLDDPPIFSTFGL